MSIDVQECSNEVDLSTWVILRERGVAKRTAGRPRPVHYQGSDCRSRLHGFRGRIYGTWYGDERREPTDWIAMITSIKKEQLDPWVPRIKEAKLKAAKVMVF